MQVIIRFFTVLREVTGKREETLLFPESTKITVNEALKMLAKRYGKPFEDYVYDAKTGEPKGFLQFLINGKSVSTLNGMQAELHDADLVAILPPVSGG